jgi:Na+-translocating ferredoxin:NAD+ oxidoreductase RnfG subunit
MSGSAVFLNYKVMLTPNKYIILIFFNLIFCSKIIEQTELRIKEVFPELISSEWSMYQIPSKYSKDIQNTVRQKFFRKEVNTWIIIDSDSSKYYAILDNVKGKSLPITFLTIFNSNSQVKDITIIKYREGYGHEIGNKKWLQQFDAYTDSSNYKVGKAISGISGATISVHSISKGIRKLSMLISHIIDDLNDK